MHRIALVQVGRRGDGEVEHVLKLIDERGLGGASIVFLPENWYSRKPVELSHILSVAEDLSSRLGVRLFAGLHYVKTGTRARSVGIYAYKGESRILCEKIHPSKPVGEREFLVPGTYVDPIEIGRLKIGCVGCVDLMYPEITRLHALRGASLVYNPASIPGDRTSMWESVGLARAVESQVYVVGVSTVGVRYPDGRITGGGSFVAHPEGYIALKAGEGEDIKVYEVNLDSVWAIRKRRGYYDDLKKLYGPFYEQLYTRLSKGAW